MKNIFYILLSLTFCYASCAQVTPRSYSDYEAVISKIRKQIVDLTAASDLFNSTNFIVLYENPASCVSNGVSFLKDKSHSDVEKMIVVYSLQKLPLEDYIGFESKLLDCAREKSIPQDLFNKAIFPGMEWSTKLECNYEREDVKVLLGSLLESEWTGEQKKAYIKQILSGEARKNVKELQDAGVLRKRD